MHHVVVERWSREASPLHSRDARAKLIALLAFLVCVATAKSQLAFAGFAAMLAAAMVASRLPVRGLLGRALLVLPFSATFALMTWWMGDAPRALMLAEKSFLSGLAALVLVATTPIAQLAAALESLGCPRILVLVVQFLYRYLFVISEQAQHMRLAAQSRSGKGVRTARFKGAAGALGVLFVRSWERADGIYQAMLARGFTGKFESLEHLHVHASDIAFACSAVLAAIFIRVAA